jgi:hypothetical protein
MIDVLFSLDLLLLIPVSIIIIIFLIVKEEAEK